MATEGAGGSVVGQEGGVYVYGTLKIFHSHSFKLKLIAQMVVSFHFMTKGLALSCSQDVAIILSESLSWVRAAPQSAIAAMFRSLENR